MGRSRRRRSFRSRPRPWRARGVLALVAAAIGAVWWWFPELRDLNRRVWHQPVTEAPVFEPLAGPVVPPASPPPMPSPAPARTDVAPRPVPVEVSPLPPEPAQVLPERAAGGTALNVFEVQLTLARQGLSPGALDGLMGSRTRNALRAFQQREGLRATGELDTATRERLRLETPAYRDWEVTASDLDRLLSLGSSWLAKSLQPRLDYETLLELVAERSFSHPDFIKRLNPAVDWARVAAGTRFRVPDVRRPPVKGKAACVRIWLTDRTLQVFDEQDRLLAHYPCSIGRTAESRPRGALRVAVLVPDPNYTFDPQRFPHTPEARELNTKLILPPGPNNPVGTVWIGLSEPGYGIHGTPHPERVGIPESLGCFRLANWNVEHLLELSWVGMPVHVEP